MGGWRLADLFDDLEMNIGVIVNAANYLHSGAFGALSNTNDEMIVRYLKRHYKAN